ncbi:MAG: molybdenum cofactor biosynthesis protein MoaE [Marmoricola sp.]
MLRLLDIREAALDVSEVLDAVADDRAGGVAVFVGNVRDHDGGQS